MLTGFSTPDALRILHNELLEQLHWYESERARRSSVARFHRSFLYHSDAYSPLQWTGVTLIVISVCLLLVAYAAQETRDNWLVVQACVLMIILIVNIYFLAWDDQLRQTEHIAKARRVLAQLEGCIKDCVWTTSNYIDLNAPLSQCVSEQWTIRDSCVVNLPCSLLVEGDVILLRPGQTVPVKCRRMKIDYEDEDGLPSEYETDDLYNPAQVFHEPVFFSKIEARQPLKPQPFVVLETPFARNFRYVLEHSHDRPVGMLDNERYAAYSVWCERRILPVVLILMLTANILRYVLITSHVGNWSEMLVILQVEAIVPLLALIFPIVWRLLDAYGVAKVDLTFDKTVRQKSQRLRDALGSNVSTNFMWRELCGRVEVVLTGKSDTLPRTASLIQVLGNMTSFCCIDKKGVLSWPNPTAEKVFMLTRPQSPSRVVTTGNHGRSKRRASCISSSGDPGCERAAEGSMTVAGGSTTTHEGHHGHSDHDRHKSLTQTGGKDYPKEATFQVLDLTQDTKNQYGLRFDDPSWMNHINSLKPLGLNILLNTCNMQTADRYTEFADHVTCASLKRDEAVPVVNRRCFCELARQIGFSGDASATFKTQLTLGMYRHIPAEMSAADRLKSPKSFIKYKMPMPNTFSVVVKDTTTGLKQMFSQGMADLLLDACSDFWDGTDIRPLGTEERKKIADFYHRTSMSSYCTAFAYRPLVEDISDDMANVYLEVPEEISIFHNPLTNRFIRSRRTIRQNCWSVDRPWNHHELPPRYHSSADSLLLDSGLSSSASGGGSAAGESCFADESYAAQCNQIFIGMITMQYQAKQDVVDLIENLDAACIRFVHFSKENELRSRVFSEKMGLEAGWNCHISLLSNNSATTDPQRSVDQSQGYASINGSREFFPVFESQLDLPPSELCGLPSRRGKRGSILRSHSAPDVIAVHNVTEIPHAPRKSEQNCLHLRRPTGDFQSPPSSSWENPDEEFSARAPLLLQQAAGRAVAYAAEVSSGRMRRPSERSVMVMYEPRRRSSSSRSVSVSVGDVNVAGVRPSISIARNAPRISRLSSTTSEQDDERIRIIVQDDTAVRRQESDPVGDADDRVSNSSYLMSRRSSYTESIPNVSSNMAQLPKGIKNIRPHIDNVDNVPLLVPLFTDCTSSTTKEMVQIMQEYGGVTCCFGSSASMENTGIFLQADCSLAIEPQYPQICVRHGVIDKLSSTCGTLGPMELSSALNTLPCSLTFTADDNITVIQHLVTLARHHCQRVRSVMLLYLKCQASLTLLQLLNSVLLLPPVLSPQLVLWLAVLVIPLLSFTLMGNPLNRQIAQMSQGKNQATFVKQTLVEEVIYFAIRYIPSLFVCLVCHAANLFSFCHMTTSSDANDNNNITAANNSDSAATEDCHIIFGRTAYNETGSWNGWSTEHHAGLVLSQHIVAFQLVLYFVLISLCSIHQLHYLWQQSPLGNRLWCLITPIIIALQLLCFAATVGATNSVNSVVYRLTDVPALTWIVALSWPVALVALYELVKRREIKMWVRRQKRARLDFGTKLGMNSPF